MHTHLLQSWLSQNIIAAVIVLLLAAITWKLSQREYWRHAAREIAHNRIAMLSFAILCLYAFVALLDSVGWRSPLRTADGTPAKDPKSGNILYDQGTSALEHLLKPLARMKETTYSAPLAATQFGTTAVSDPDGRVRRIHKKLNFPRRHLLGTDIIGSDVIYLAIKSIRTGLIIGFLASFLAIPFALFFGLCAGYYGGWVDDAVQYICTLLSSIPSVLLIAAMMVAFGRGLPQLCLAMGIASWTGLCRLLRGEALRLREADFTQAAIAIGLPSRRIILRHILPNVLHIVLINVVLRFSGLVLTEATLTYLGIGVSAETMSWGTMINDARTELTRDPLIWWKLTGAFIFMLGLVLPASLFGDAVRDALDPRLRTQD